MKHPRFSIAALMVVVMLCGVATAALRSASKGWAVTVFTIALLTLGIAVLAAMLGHGPGRSFAVGFVLFGFGYWLLSSGPWFMEAVRPRLVTTRLVEGMRDRVEMPLSVQIAFDESLSQDWAPLRLGM
jgi:hypothetical protein